jgi:hypothetical protein
LKVRLLDNGGRSLDNEQEVVSAVAWIHRTHDRTVT